MGQVIDIRQILLDRIFAEFEFEKQLIDQGIEPDFEPYETVIYQFPKLIRKG